MTPPASRSWDAEIAAFRDLIPPSDLPAVLQMNVRCPDPYPLLVSTLISLRTRDEVTEPASQRLLAQAPSPAALVSLEEETVAKLIYPAGFYRVKARQLREIGALLLSRHGGLVPKEKEALLALPGVGLKTANLVLGHGFGVPAICVDIHVHRIANRRGWVCTTRPDDTEKALEKIIPPRFWIELNGLLVRWGQKICTPRSPWCRRCPLLGNCPQTGVHKHR